jgi:DNA-binding LacI/PurR family transcriptional regulator
MKKLFEGKGLEKNNSLSPTLRMYLNDQGHPLISSTTISAIRQPLEQMSKEAVRILKEVMEGTWSKANQQKIDLKVKFIPRESCA